MRSHEVGGHCLATAAPSLPGLLQPLGPVDEAFEDVNLRCACVSICVCVYIDVYTSIEMYAYVCIHMFMYVLGHCPV